MLGLGRLCPSINALLHCVESVQAQIGHNHRSDAHRINQRIAGTTRQAIRMAGVYKFILLSFNALNLTYLTSKHVYISFSLSLQSHGYWFHGFIGAVSHIWWITVARYRTMMFENRARYDERARKGK